MSGFYFLLDVEQAFFCGSYVTKSDSKELLLKRPRTFPLCLLDFPGGLAKGDTGVIRGTAVGNMGGFVSSYN